jgi:NAD(P)-dependent dehydrogenase (short-subunit alcohol dehydrogenase family)
MKTYLVTGGTSGVGKAIATGIAQTGANVVIVSRTASNAEKAVREIFQKTGNKNISYLTADFSLMKSVSRLCEEFKLQHTELHGLINVAGSWFFKQIMNIRSLLVNCSRLKQILHHWNSGNLLTKSYCLKIHFLKLLGITNIFLSLSRER